MSTSTDTVNITVLFTDLVKSTELSQRLSAPDADEFRRRHFSILRQAISKLGGTEVKNLGDGLMVVFTSPSAALQSAVVMQQGVERNNAVGGHEIGLRVGLSGGEVSLEDGDYFGDPIIEAARLCANAESGQILASRLVQAMAGRRSRHEFRDLGPTALKGLTEAIEVVEILWEPAGDADVPLPSRLSVRPPVGTIGREVETNEIAGALKEVTGSGGRELILISGEAGMGKTTLVSQVARTAFDSGALVLFGHCEEDLASPYQLFFEAFEHYAANAPEEQLLAHVAVHGSELAGLAPALAKRIPNLPPSRATDADTERYLLFSAAVGLVAMLSERQLVVLIFEDLQWADKASLLLLRHLISADQASRLLILGTFRDSELSQASALRETLGVLHQQRSVRRIELSGLNDLGVIAYMEVAAGRTLEESEIDFAHALYRETDGNPYFVSEVLRHLSETGAIFQDETGRWRVKESLDRMALPDSVREVIGGRVVRLGERAERILGLAAVIGRDFDLELLAKVSGSSEDELMDTLDAAAWAALVREVSDGSSRYSFAHALIQHTLYADLGTTRRSRAHRQIAVALEEILENQPGVRVGELARHWTSATQPSNLVKAVDYSRQAADAALRALAPGDALGYYAQAIELLAQGDTHDAVLELDLAIGLGTAQRQTGDPAFRDTLLAAAKSAADLDDTDRLVEACLATNRGFFSAIGAIDVEKVAILELALERLDASHPTRALVLASLCAELGVGSSFERRKALAEEALTIARRTGDDAVIVRVLNAIAFPLMVPQELEAARERTGEAMERANRVGDPVQILFAHHWREEYAACVGDFVEMDRVLEVVRGLVEQLDQPTLRWVYLFTKAWRSIVDGDIDVLERIATESYEVGTASAQPDAFTMYGGQLVSVYFQRGTLGELVPILEQLVEQAPEVSGIVRGALALAHGEAGSTEELRRCFDAFASEGHDLPLDATWLLGMAWWADAAILLGDPAHAGPIFDQFVPWPDLWPSSGAEIDSPISQYLGGLATVLGRYDEAVAYFEHASDQCQRAGAKFFNARTNLLWGKALLARGAVDDVASARELLTTARDVSVASGYASVERRAREALDAIG